MSKIKAKKTAAPIVKTGKLDDEESSPALSTASKVTKTESEGCDTFPSVSTETILRRFNPSSKLSIVTVFEVPLYISCELSPFWTIRE